MKALPYSTVRRYRTYLYSPEFSAAATSTLGEIDVDPCACAGEQFIRAKQTWSGLTKRTDGYLQPWNGNVFFNCDNYERPLKNPLTKETIECPHEFHKMSDWVDKLKYEMESGRTKQCVGFFPAHMFKGWTHAFVLRNAAAICFHTRKLSFYISDIDDQGVHNITKAQYSNVGDGYMTCLFSDSEETLQRFKNAYNDYGTVVKTSLL